jgi:hypothetical protein
MINRTRRSTGVLLILLSISILGVSAFVYEMATQQIDQRIIEIANISLLSPDLGDIDEGETKSYNKSTVADLGDAITITTTKAGVYLHLNSDLNDLLSVYEIYTIDVKYDTVPGGSAAIPGNIAFTMTTATPDPAPITLDAAGTWTFDFEITTKPYSVMVNTNTTVEIIVSAESTT